MKFSVGQRVVVNPGIVNEGRGGLVVDIKTPNGFNKAWLYGLRVDGQLDITYYNEDELKHHPNPNQPDTIAGFKFNVGDKVRVVNPGTIFWERTGVVLYVDPSAVEKMPYKIQLDGTDRDGAMFFAEKELELIMNTKLTYEDLIPAILAGKTIQRRINSIGFNQSWGDVTKGEALQWVGSDRTDFELRLKPDEQTVYMGVYLREGTHNVYGVWGKPDHVPPKDNTGRPLIDRLQLVVVDGRVKSVKVV